MKYWSQLIFFKSIKASESTSSVVFRGYSYLHHRTSRRHIRPAGRYSRCPRTWPECSGSVLLHTDPWTRGSTLLGIATSPWFLHRVRVVSPVPSSPDTSSHWARYRRRLPRSHWTTSRSTRPGLWVRCTHRGRGLFHPPSLHSRCHHRQSRNDHPSSRKGR